ncbi:MAG: hypothetical protein AAF828_09760 [Bacteroidota bacterium]
MQPLSLQSCVACQGGTLPGWFYCPTQGQLIYPSFSGEYATVNPLVGPTQNHLP